MLSVGGAPVSTVRILGHVGVGISVVLVKSNPVTEFGVMKLIIVE